LKQSQVVLRDTGETTCGHRRPLAFRRLTAILVPLSEDAIALGAGTESKQIPTAVFVCDRFRQGTNGDASSGADIHGTGTVGVDDRGDPAPRLFNVEKVTNLGATGQVDRCTAGELTTDGRRQPSGVLALAIEVKQPTPAEFDSGSG